jgi:hypothetical protein
MIERHDRRGFEITSKAANNHTNLKLLFYRTIFPPCRREPSKLTQPTDNGIGTNNVNHHALTFVKFNQTQAHHIRDGLLMYRQVGDYSVLL